MSVQVSGRHVDVGEALRRRIETELSAGIGRIFERGGSAEVVVSRDGHGFRVDCAILLASGQALQCHGLGGDAPAAFNQALEKAVARVRRYKQRLKSHAPGASAKAAETAALMVLRPPGEEDDELDGWSDANTPPAAMIIAETETALRTMTVSMAVLELDLIETQTIVFRNAAHGGLSVVYRRTDGNIGWIDPARIKTGGARGRVGRKESVD